jgi:hypothetical protein
VGKIDIGGRFCYMGRYKLNSLFCSLKQQKLYKRIKCPISININQV